MYVTYRPAGGEPTRYHFDQDAINNMEAEAVERETGLTWGEFGDRLLKGSVLAARALLWMLQRRQHPTLRFADVRFQLSEVDVDMEEAELLRARDAILQQTRDLTPADQQALDIIAGQLAALEVPGDKPAPKARAKNAASPTS